jgi:hypothetical protein
MNSRAEIGTLPGSKGNGCRGGFRRKATLAPSRAIAEVFDDRGDLSAIATLSWDRSRSFCEVGSAKSRLKNVVSGNFFCQKPRKLDDYGLHNCRPSQ